MNKSFKLGGLIAGIVVILFMIFMIITIERVEPGYAGVVYNASGGIEEETLDQGYHFVAPWKKVIEYPISTETEYLSKDPKEGSKDDDSVYTSTADGKSVNMDISYTYHYEANNLKNIFTKFRAKKAEYIASTYLRRQVKDTMNNITTQYGVFDLYGIKRPEIALKIQNALKEVLKVDVAFETFNITDVRPDKATLDSIQATVNAMQELKRLEIEKQKTSVEAERKKIEADGEATKKRIEADATAYANDKVNSSVNDKMIRYILANKWNGENAKVISGANQQILNVPQEMIEAKK